MIKFNEGTHSKEVVVVLRNDGAGPLLRGLFYDTDFQLTGDIQVGKNFTEILYSSLGCT